jgi:hypothetical protein
MCKREAWLATYATAQCVARELDRIGEAVHCWRLSRREPDRDFAARLAIHIQESIIDRETLLDLVLSLGNSQTGSDRSNGNGSA